MSTRVSAKKYKTKIRSVPKKRREENAKKRKWYLEHKEQVLESLHRKRENLTKEQKYRYNQRKNGTQHFGSLENREAAVKRDGEKCTQCGITREDHKTKWNQDLHVDHKDGYGRNVTKKTQNNSLDNLETLCVSCHGVKSNTERKMSQDKLAVLLYGKDFTEALREKIREKYERKCFDCQTPEKQFIKKLPVHHLDGNKHNNKEENLIPVCLKCHYIREHSSKK